MGIWNSVAVDSDEDYLARTQKVSVEYQLWFYMKKILEPELLFRRANDAHTWAQFKKEKKKYTHLT